MEQEPIRKRLCKNCRHKIDAPNFQIHSVNCLPGKPMPFQSKIKKIGSTRMQMGKTGTSIEAGENKKQQESQECEKILCNLCGFAQTFSQLDTHPGSCPNREVSCQYCLINYPKNLMHQHKNICQKRPSQYRPINTSVRLNTLANEQTKISNDLIPKYNPFQRPAQTSNNSTSNASNNPYASMIEQIRDQQLQQLRRSQNEIRQLQRNERIKYQEQKKKIMASMDAIKKRYIVNSRFTQPARNREQEATIVPPKSTVVIPPHVPQRPPLHGSANRINLDQTAVRVRPISQTRMQRGYSTSEQLIARVANLRQNTQLLPRNINITQYIYERANRNTDQPTGLNKQQITKIPTKSFKKTQSQQQNCSICYCQIHENHIIADLPCKHLYHSQCISKWVAINTLCPLCKSDLSKIAVSAKNKRQVGIVKPKRGSVQISRWYDQDVDLESDQDSDDLGGIDLNDSADFY